jgi:hypothetical protein
VDLEGIEAAVVIRSVGVVPGWSCQEESGARGDQSGRPVASDRPVDGRTGVASAKDFQPRRQLSDSSWRLAMSR